METLEFIKDNEELKNERNNISEKLLQDSEFLVCLKNNKIDYELIKEFPMKFNRLYSQFKLCKNCKGLEYCPSNKVGYQNVLVFEDGFLKEIIKKCKYQVEADNNQKALEIKNPHYKNYWLNDLPQDQRNVEIEMIDVIHEDNADYLKALIEIKNWLNNPNNKGLYLYGNVGVGKTYLAACVSNKFAKDNKKIVFVHLPSFVVKLKNSFDDDNNYEKLINYCIKCDVLVLDDIGAEIISSWYRDEVLLPILNTRMNEKKLTIFTSNYDINELEIKFKYTNKGEVDEIASQRLCDRIRVLSNPIKVVGKNRRV